MRVQRFLKFNRPVTETKREVAWSRWDFSIMVQFPEFCSFDDLPSPKSLSFLPPALVMAWED
jgi:hypothetical protein